MGRIKVLDKFLIDRIAAGEVVQRPLNVVKELFENSIDANASNIIVEIKDGGKSYIRITDNGMGMSHEDALISFKRHATSKISDANDLYAISTLGFRGEALCAISAVSHMQISTKSEAENTGIVLNINGGVLQDKREIGMSKGTNITVKNLFYNTPARLKFLKQSGTEASAISEIVSKFIISYPDIAIKFISNGKIMLQSFGDSKLISSLQAVYGYDIQDKTYKLDYQKDDISIKGYIGKPEYSYKTRKMQSIFVNNRYVENGKINDWVKRAYANRIVSGVFPFFVLNISIPVEKTDVNIHPNKLEIKFSQEDIVESTIFEAIDNVLSQSVSIPKISLENEAVDTPKIKLPSLEDNPAYEIKKPSEIEVDHFVKEDSDDNTHIDTSQIFGMYDYDSIKIKNIETVDFDIDDNNQVLTTEESNFTSSDKSDKYDSDIDIENEIHIADEGLKKEFLIPTDEMIKPRLIGEFLNSYLLVEVDRKLLLIDQHAAHEKINYDKFKMQFNDSKILIQSLLIPKRISVSLEEKNILEDNLDTLKRIGVLIDTSYDLSVEITGVPMLLSNCSAEEILDDVLQTIDRGQESLEKIINKLIMRSCKKSIKAGNVLQFEDAEYLINEFLNSGGIPNCPHGRPIMTVLTENEIKKYFKRIV